MPLREPLRAGRLGLCAAVLVWAGGCAAAGREIGAAAAPPLVNGALHEVNAADSQQQIQRLADSKAFQNAGQSIGKGVGIGLFDEANKLTGGGEPAEASPGSGANEENTAKGATRPTTGPGGSGARPGSQPATAAAAAKRAGSPGGAAIMGLAGGGGGLNSFVKSSVQEAFLAATDPQFQAGEAKLAEAVGEGFIRGLLKVADKEGPGLGDRLRRQLGPMLRELLREQVAPAVREVIEEQVAPTILKVWREGAVDTLKLTVRPDLQPDVIQNAHNASIGASRGTHEAMVESGLLSPNGGLSGHIRAYLIVGVGALAVIALSAFSLLVLLNLLVLHHWRRRHRGDAKSA